MKYDPTLYSFLTTVVSYVMGYLVYGLGIIKDEFLKSISSTERIEKLVNSRTDFTMAITKYNNFIQTNNLGNQLANNISTRQLRTLVFSFLNTDEKNLIYTFMFRSDLCKHLYNMFLLLGSLGALACGIVKFMSEDFDLLKADKNSFWIFIGMIIISFVFRSTRNYFYDKAIKIPFSMYLSK